MSISLLWLLLAASGQSAPEPSSDIIAAGRSLALRNCAECHAVVPGGVARLDGAPAFTDLGKIFPVRLLDEALEQDRLSVLPHMKRFDLGPDERAELQAYVISIQGSPLAAPTGP